jgi:hypothetical protein
MRRHTFRGTLVTLAALAVGGTALIAGPAQAATSTIQITIDSKTTTVKAEYGSYLGGVDGSVDFVDDQGQTIEAENGTAQLQVKKPGADWTVLASDTDPGFLYFPNQVQKAKGNAQYRVYYTGGTFTDVNGNTQTVDPSYSNVVTVKTLYKFAASGKCGSVCRVHGKVAPNYKHKKVKVLVRHGKHGAFKKLKVFKTDGRSRFKGVLPGNRSYYYKFVVKSTKNFTGVVAGPYSIV